MRPKRGPNWNDGERKIIRRCAGRMAVEDIAAQLPGRSVYAVQHEARNMGVSLRRRGEHHPKAVYRDAQIQQACDLYLGGTMTMRKAAEAAGVNYHSLHGVINGKLRQPEVRT